MGIEINPEVAHISQMALSILSNGSVTPEIFVGNALERVKHPYTKAYVFPTFGISKVLNENIRKVFYFQNSIYQIKILQNGCSLIIC